MKIKHLAITLLLASSAFTTFAETPTKTAIDQKEEFKILRAIPDQAKAIRTVIGVDPILSETYKGLDGYLNNREIENYYTEQSNDINDLADYIVSFTKESNDQDMHEILKISVAELEEKWGNKALSPEGKMVSMQTVLLTAVSNKIDKKLGRTDSGLILKEANFYKGYGEIPSKRARQILSNIGTPELDRATTEELLREKTKKEAIEPTSAQKAN